MKDEKLVQLNFLQILIEKENVKQLDKWGVQDHSPSEWMMFLTEEVGELAQAIGDFEYRKEQSEKDIVNEAIQVATLALKIAEMYGIEINLFQKIR